MANAPVLIVVAAALVDGDGRVLVQKRPPDGAMPNVWEFPGGKVEGDETPEAALKRELFEELGIETDTSCLAPLSFASEALGERHLLLLLYVCRKWRGTPRPLHAPELKWVFPLELYTLSMPPADRPLIPMIEALL